MALFDIFLLIVLSGFVYFGFHYGLFHMIGSLVGTIIGLFASAYLSGPVFNWIGWMFGGGGFARASIFVVIFLLIAKILSAFFWVLERFFKLARIIPFVQTTNTMLGGLLGLFEGILILGIILYYVKQFMPGAESVIDGSAIASGLVMLTGFLHYLLPADVRLAFG